MRLKQRELFRLLDRITQTSAHSREDLLQFFVRQIVDHPELQIDGGRIWKLNAEKKQYQLLYQYGKVQKIPENYTIPIDESPTFTELTKKPTVLHHETHSLLKRSGIRLYSAAGVGKLIRVNGRKYYEYVLAFNAPSIDENFRFLLSLIRNIANIRLREIESTEEQEILEKDLRQAWEIQKKLLPDHEAQFRDYEIFGASIPDRVVGGDYFDYFTPSEDPDDRLGIVISDAASKGLPAAIQALYVAGALRMGVAFYAKMTSLITRLNDLLCAMFPDERFVSLFYCELTSSQNGLLLYVNAGHEAPIHFQKKNRQIHYLDVTGSVLGIVAEQRFRLENINLAPGDILTLYSDGITEARNKHGQFFGQKRLERLILKHHSLSARQLCYKILEEVQKFSVDADYTDDRTVIVVKRKDTSIAHKTSNDTGNA